jgi:DNA-binding CsgD family transcriptional regulator
LADEDRWIEALQSMSYQHGYNCTRGGSGPDTRTSKRKTREPVRLTEEAKHKIGVKNKARHAKNREPLLHAVKELHSQGLSNVQICDETGLTVVTVRTYLTTLGLVSNARKRSPQEALPEITQLALSGHTVKEISRIAKAKESTVRRLIEENGLPTNRHRTGRVPGSIDDKFEEKKKAAIPVIIELRLQGKTKREIRAHVGMGVAFVGKVLRDYSMQKLPK